MTFNFKNLHKPTPERVKNFRRATMRLILGLIAMGGDLAEMLHVTYKNFAVFLGAVGLVISYACSFFGDDGKDQPEGPAAE